MMLWTGVEKPQGTDVSGMWRTKDLHSMQEQAFRGYKFNFQVYVENKNLQAPLPVELYHF